MWERINRLIDSTTDQLYLLHNGGFRKTQTLFIEHVCQIIYKDH